MNLISNRKCRNILTILTILTFLFTIFSTARGGFAEGQTGGAAIVYDFHKLGITGTAGTQGTQEGWKVAELHATKYSYLDCQVYGLRVATFFQGEYLKLNFDVPEDGIYAVSFKGALAGSGAVISIKVDDKTVGSYNFYNKTYIAEGPVAKLRTLSLSKGTHELILTTVEEGYNETGKGGFNMYPAEFRIEESKTLPQLVNISVQTSKEQMVVGQKAKLTVTETFSDGFEGVLSDGVIEYISSDESVAAVDAGGIVTAVGAGTSKITAKVTEDGIEKEANIEITVLGETLDRISLSSLSSELLVKQEGKINVTGWLTNAQEVDLSDAVLNYTSSNVNVATVDNNGVVKAVGEGTAEINVSATLGNVMREASILLTVKKLLLDKIDLSIDKVELIEGGTGKAHVAATMNNGMAADLTAEGFSTSFKSQDEGVASIDQNGIITALKKGSTNITVSVSFNGVTLNDSLEVTVISKLDIRNSKTRSTVYTPEKIQNARQNIDKYDWAKDMRDSTITLADKYVDLGYEFLWNIVTPQSIPRSYALNEQCNCPVCGRDVFVKFGSYPYLLDPVNAPWKIVCPNCGLKFPTNDYGKYYKSGLDKNGIFDSNLADKSLLKNELYPEKGDKWGVDDGYGFVDENGTKYTFIAYYNHWALWYDGIIEKALNTLRDAFIYTGDMKYARAGSILLDRIADVYPQMDISAYAWEDGFCNSHGLNGQGKILGCIWETGIIQVFLRAYDAFFPAMDDAEIIEFLSQKAQQYNMDNPKGNGGNIRRNIEDGIVKQVYPAVQKIQIHGNTGMHQSALALAAVVYDTMPETKEWLDFNYQAGTYSSVPPKLTGGDIIPVLVNDIDRDGYGNETAPGYNVLWLDQLKQVADVLKGYDGYAAADLYLNPKFKKMFYLNIPLILCSKYTAQIGDSGETGNVGLIPELRTCIAGFEAFGDPLFAQMAYFINGNRIDGIYSDIFSQDPVKVASDIQRTIDEKGPLDLKSENLAGYGFAVLRDGKYNYNYKDAGLIYRFLDLPIASQSKPCLRFDDYWQTLRFEAEAPGDEIAIQFNVANANNYLIALNALKSYFLGIYEISVDGRKLGECDFYGAGGSVNRKFDAIGSIQLSEGTHEISFKCTGKNAASSGYKLGLIRLALLDEAAQADFIEMENNEDTQRDAWIFYGRNSLSHGHRDALNLGLHAYGLDISPDLGYPEATGLWPERHQWTNNTISHNTVVVDGVKQQPQYDSGIPHHFDDSGMVKLFDIEAPEAYPQTDMYRRTTAMIKVDAADSYVVDFFRVKGGNDHYFSFHGAQGNVTTEGLNLVQQATGTYAGQNILFADTNYAEKGYIGNEYYGSGFHYLENVRRDEAPSAPFSVDWDIVDSRQVLQGDQDIHLKLTMLTDVDDVAIADGHPPKKPRNPESLKYLVAHRAGKNLDSIFASVLQPYRESEFIDSMAKVPVKTNNKVIKDGSAIAIKVVMKNGRVDYIVNALDKNTVYTVDDKFQFKGFFGVYSQKGDEQAYAYLNDGTAIGDIIDGGVDSISGTVRAFTKEMSTENEMTVQIDTDSVKPDDLVGRYIYVQNDGTGNAAYRINGIKAQDGRNIALDIGDITLIRRLADVKDITKGYIYNIAEGNRFNIPLSRDNCQKSSNVFLKDIKVNGVPITGFTKEESSYTVWLPYGTVNVPEVTAAAEDDKAEVQVGNAAGLPGTTEIKVTAQDGVSVKVYQVNFYISTPPGGGDENTNDGGDVKGPSGTTKPQIPGDASITENAKIKLEEVLKEAGSDEDKKENVLAVIEKAVKEAANVAVNPEDISLDGNKATLEVGIDALANAAQKVVDIVKELEQKAKDAGVDVKAQKVITVEVPKVEGASEVSVKLPVEFLDKAKEKGIDCIVVGTGVGTIAVTPDTLRNSIGKDVKKVEFSMAQVDKEELPKMVAEKVGDKRVYDFNAYTDGEKISKFTGKKAVQIKMPYALKAGENPDKIVVCCINGKGGLEAVRNGKYNEETGMVTFTTNHFGQYTIQHADATFSDIKEIAWAKNSIEALAARGIIDGKGENLFDPDSSITRAEFIRMLMNAFDLVDETVKATFSDVPEDAWYYAQAASAQKLGIVSGVGGNEFAPDRFISRQEMVTMAYRAAGIAEAKLKIVKEVQTFADNDEIAGYAKESVKVMQQAGIIHGVGENQFAPNGEASRAMAAKIVYLLFKRL